MAKKKTIGNNPLSAYIDFQKTEQIEFQEKKDITSESATTQRVTIHVDVNLINAVKDAVYWEPGLTLTAFAHQAFTKELEVMEKNYGKKYPKRQDRNLRGGRPIG